jgi:hypothetical protein
MLTPSGDCRHILPVLDLSKMSVIEALSASLGAI